MARSFGCAQDDKRWDWRGGEKNSRQWRGLTGIEARGAVKNIEYRI
ncbi:MAG: hypothetical protein ACYS30_05970 [Planctomycetota bacterium]